MKRFAAIALALLTSASAYAQTPPPPAEASVVVSTGEGIVKHAPDRAWVTIAAESRAKTPGEAQKLNADAMSAVMQKIKGTSIPAEAVRTASYDLQPEFDYANGKQTLRGYVARNSVEVRIDDLAKLGSVIDVSVGAGATSVSNIRFDLKDRTAAEQEALKLAVADAKSQADAAAQAAGVKVERIVRLEVHRDVVGTSAPAHDGHALGNGRGGSTAADVSRRARGSRDGDAHRCDQVVDAGSRATCQLHS